MTRELLTNVEPLGGTGVAAGCDGAVVETRYGAGRNAGVGCASVVADTGALLVAGGGDSVVEAPDSPSISGCVVVVARTSLLRG